MLNVLGCHETGTNYMRLLILTYERNWFAVKRFIFGLVHLCRGDPCQDLGGKLNLVP